jgi:hypothetical protein
MAILTFTRSQKLAALRATGAGTGSVQLPVI